ncbi:MAG: CBS domain-containing protein [Ornithinimicrobium sp.]
MRINEVIRRKGSTVATVQPSEPVAHLVDVLAEKGIGSVVVSEDGDDVVGIVSERDVVRGLREHGADLLNQPVSSIMTADVHTCTPEDDLESLARTMTEHHIRHLPVTVEGHLRGIVSIGDIVKIRIDELQGERDQLVGYLQQ